MSKATISGEMNYRGGFYVKCTSDNCYCSFGEGYDRDAMPDHQFISPTEAIKTWNNRGAK
jgi:hypothetical protein